MNISTHDLPKQKAIEIKVEGQLSMPLRQEILTNALFAMRAHGYSRLLIDISRTTFAPDETLTDALQVVNMMRRLGFTANDRIALLRHEHDSRTRFFENTANSDSFTLKYFKNRDDAVLWLSKQQIEV